MNQTTQPTEQAETDNLTAAELSSLVDMIQAQIEWHEREVARLECIRKRLRRGGRRTRHHQEALQ